MVLLHFWNKDEALQAQYQLENQYQTMHFYGEENLKIQDIEGVDMN